MKTIYLAGNIASKTYADSVGWRNSATYKLRQAGFTVLDPMRDKPELANVEGPLGFTHDNYTAFQIVSRDLGDVLRSDIILAVLDDWSLGTIFELGFAYRHKRERLVVVLLGKMSEYKHHPFISETSTVFHDVQDAIDYVLNKYNK